MFTEQETKVVSKLKKTFGWKPTLCRLHGNLTKEILNQVNSWLLQLKQELGFKAGLFVSDLKVLALAVFTLGCLREILLRKINFDILKAVKSLQRWQTVGLLTHHYFNSRFYKSGSNSLFRSLSVLETFVSATTPENRLKKHFLTSTMLLDEVGK